MEMRRVASKFLIVSFALLAAGLPGAAALPQDRVVLKSGRELVGRFGGERDHKVYFVDDEVGAVVVPRVNVRTIVPGDAEPGLFAPLVLEPAKEGPPKSFIRFEAPADERPGALLTAIARLFDEKTRTTVFLVGAVHVADHAYFERVQDLLDGCDRVLFEGVGHGKAGSPPPEEEVARYDALFRLQLKLKDLLGLEFQKDGVDYRRDFWKNADVDMESLSARMKEEGVGLPTDPPLVRGLLSLVMGVLDGSKLADNPQFRQQIKRQAAAALATSDVLFSGQMRGLNKVLIEWRNDAALAAFDHELAAGPKGRWIAIFYGAGHLSDMTQKLLARGLEYQGTDWLRAWVIE
jgi:hypothetical protein